MGSGLLLATGRGGLCLWNLLLVVCISMVWVQLVETLCEILQFQADSIDLEDIPLAAVMTDTVNHRHGIDPTCIHDLCIGAIDVTAVRTLRLNCRYLHVAVMSV